MENKVIINTFSNGKQISSRELDWHTYYDELHPEIDDNDYIISNSIDMTEQHFYADNSYSLTRIYYQDGKIIKYETLENGNLEVEYV